MCSSDFVASEEKAQLWGRMASSNEWNERSIRLIEDSERQEAYLWWNAEVEYIRS